MEVVGVVLGAIPIIVEAVKAYRVTLEKIGIFRRRAHELNLAQTRLSAQQAVFKNECFQLLKAALQDPTLVSQIIEGNPGVFPLSSKFETRLQKFLGNNYQVCKQIIQTIREQLVEIQSDLDKISPLQPRGSTNNHFKEFTSSVKSGFVLCFEKNNYTRKIENLRELREDLATLIRQVTRSGEAVVHDKHRHSVLDNEMCTHFRTVREASATLHEALSQVWNQSCREMSHSQHYTILCLDATVDNDVRLDLAISYERGDSASMSRPASMELPTWLYVRSTTDSFRAVKMCGKRRLVYNDAVDLRSSLISRERSQSSNLPQLSQTPKDSAFPTPQTLRKKKRSKNHNLQGSLYQAMEDTRNSENFEDAEPQAVPDASQNLSELENICQHFQRHLCYESPSNQACFGYLESSKAFRHFVYSTTEQNRCTGSKQCSPTTLSHIIHEASYETLDCLYQLKISQKLALAVLQYHATPWMHSEWDLRDIGLFCSTADLDEAALRTLHLSAIFPKDCQFQRNGPSQSSDTTNLPRSIQSDRVNWSASSSCSCQISSRCCCQPDSLNHQSRLYGVNNMTLCNLGIALLQISHRKNLQSLKIDTDPNLLYTARRLADGRASPISPRFKDIVLKCLGCDFGAGTDLEDPKLQKAVYSGVVSELEDMVRSMSKQQLSGT